MKILHLVESYGLGSEWFITDLICHQADFQDLDIHVAFRRKMFQEKKFPNVHESECPYKFSNDDWTVHENCDNEAVAQWYIDQIEKLSPDIIHIHFLTEALKVVPFLQSLEIGFIVNVYGGDSCIAFHDLAFRKKAQNIMGNALKVITICEFLAKELVFLGCSPGKIHIVKLGVPESLFQTSLQDRNKKPKKIVAAARLVGKKGIDKLIIAFSLMFNGDETLDIYGDGEMRANVMQLIAQLKLQDRVRILGFQERHLLLEKLPDYDLYILPSHTSENYDEEGTPTVLLEAQAIGIPVIATKHAGTPEIFHSECRFLLSRQSDITSLCESIRKYIEYPDKQSLVKKSRAFVQAHHSIDKITNDHIEHYFQLTNH